MGFRVNLGKNKISGIPQISENQRLVTKYLTTLKNETQLKLKNNLADSRWCRAEHMLQLRGQTTRIMQLRNSTSDSN